MSEYQVYLKGKNFKTFFWVGTGKRVKNCFNSVRQTTPGVRYLLAQTMFICLRKNVLKLFSSGFLLVGERCVVF